MSKTGAITPNLKEEVDFPRKKKRWKEEMKYLKNKNYNLYQSDYLLVGRKKLLGWK